MRACLFTLRLYLGIYTSHSHSYPFGYNVTCGCRSVEAWLGHVSLSRAAVCLRWSDPVSMVLHGVSETFTSVWLYYKLYFHYRIRHLQFWSVWDEALHSFCGNFSSWRKCFMMFTGLSKLFVLVTGTNIILEFPCVLAKKIVPFRDGLTLTPPIQG